ncbi:MAG TPA: hemolysin family protein [Longimicrobiales bacterium]|nr:hemolysin family protein [Longimicrobiales bacterium]
MLLIAAGLVLAILSSAFFSAAELAIFFPSESRLRTLSEKNVRGANALAQLRSRPERTLVLLRLADAASDVTAGALTAYLTFLEWQIVGLAVAIGVVSFLVLYLGELIPMGIAAHHGQRIALAVAPALLLLTRGLGPLLVVLARLARMRPERRDTVSTITETEIRQLTALGHTEGEIEEHERELIERAFRLDETKTWEVMIPRVDIFAWQDARSLGDIAAELGTVRYSRVPVYGESIDDITGVLYLRDAYQALVSGQHEMPLQELAREPLVVPGSLPLSRLLRDFQARRIHLAVVVDEYGGTDGLVTLEDVLEELVGEIVDETDVAEDAITRISRSEILAWGDADLREINHYFNAALPQLEHRSLNGYLLEELGRVPEPGEELERDGIHIAVLEATETQVTRARLRRVGHPPEAHQTGDDAADGRDAAQPESEPAAAQPAAGKALAADGDAQRAR